ncbi:uncharacterized protein majin [Genypterus blacodes]|uniref:uncharacterized protein majin n=1 Tax=Genypterus blacodes TaxID=154954 RepID=UPI003F772F1E
MYVFSGKKVTGRNNVNQEMEDIIRTVLANLDSPQPFSSTHFNVFPYKKPWRRASKVMFKHGEEKLAAYPFIFILYLENNTLHGSQAKAKRATGKEETPSCSVVEPQPKRSRRDSPLEEAILKGLMMDMEMTPVSVDGQHAERQIREETGSDGRNGSQGFVDSQGGEVCVLRLVNTDEEDVPPEEGEDDEQSDQPGTNVDSPAGSAVRPALLTRLASHIFPFSLFFREA